MIREDGRYKWIEEGEGNPIILLHGLMGGVSKFEGVLDYFPQKGYQVLVPELPVYSLPVLNTSVKSLSEFLHTFIIHKELKDIILLGNSLGGHIGLMYTIKNPNKVKQLVLTGSSGLYENSFGGSFPKRGDYGYINDLSLIHI